MESRGLWRRALSAGLLAIIVAGPALAQRPTNVPLLSSNAGGPYTVYLDFTGFSFTGTWGGNQPNPSATAYAAYRNVTGSFTTAQQDEIREIWARTAEKFAPFGINVTTIDPAGTGLLDSQRQAFYDAQIGIQHTVISPRGAVNDSTAGGESFVDVMDESFSTTSNGGAGSGYNTNFIEAPAAPTYPVSFMLKSVAETVAHENGHAFKLDHQSDYNSNGTILEEYSDNYGAGGSQLSVNAPKGSFAPIMGFADFTQRGLWRSGRSSPLGGAIQNDVGKIMTQTRFSGYFEDGIGNTFATATPLPLDNGSVDAALAKGVIVPLSTTSPNPLGEQNYQAGYFSFTTGGGTVTLRANNGSSLLQDGVADPGMTLRNILRIYDASRSLVATGVEDSLTRWTEYSGSLPAGDYYVSVNSSGGFTSTEDATANYFNMGSYFLTGSLSGTPVPMPLVFDVGGGQVQSQTTLGYAFITNSEAESVTKTGAGVVVFDAANTYSGPTAVTAGTLRVATNSAIGATAVTVGTGATLEASAGVTIQSPGVTLTGGTLAATNLVVDPTGGISALNIDAGSLAGSPFITITGGGAVMLSRVGRVSVSVSGLRIDETGTGGQLDLGAGEILIAAGGITPAELRADLLVGGNGGNWDGPTGIISSLAATSNGTRTVGYRVAGDGSTVVSFAAPGDTDLSGEVNVFDLVAINGSGTYGNGLPSVWSQGDFDYNGVTNVFDLVSINSADVYGQGSYLPPAVSGAAVTAVPEPAGWIMVAGLCGGAAALWRRGRVSCEARG